MSQRMDIAEAVVAELNGAPEGTFSMDFEAARYALLETTPEALKALRVAVFMRTFTSERDSRGDHDRQITIDIGVQKHLAEITLPVVDALSDLVEEIIGYFEQTPQLSQYARGVCVQVENDAPYYMPHLTEKNIFTSVITLTFATESPEP